MVTGLRLLWGAAWTGRGPELAIGLAVLTGAGGGALETSSVRAVMAGGEAALAFPVQAVARMLYMAGSAALFCRRLAGLPSRPGLGAHPGRHRRDRVAGRRHRLGLGGAAQRGARRGCRNPGLPRGARQQLRVGRHRFLPHWNRLRRRWRVGLVEHVIAQQFFLWGVASLATVALIAADRRLPRAAGHVAAGRAPQGVILLAVLGLLAGTTIYSAFFPPLALPPLDDRPRRLEATKRDRNQGQSPQFRCEAPELSGTVPLVPVPS